MQKKQINQMSSADRTRPSFLSSRITALLDDRRFEIFLALLIITLAAQIRTYDLGGRSLWLDEASIVNWASQSSLKEVWVSIGPQLSYGC